MQDFVKLLNQEEVERIHEASLEILESVGLLVRNQRAREILQKHGAIVDPDTEIVRFPRQIVEHYRAYFPPSFTFQARDPAYDRKIPDDSPLILTGSSAPN